MTAEKQKVKRRVYGSAIEYWSNFIVFRAGAVSYIDFDGNHSWDETNSFGSAPYRSDEGPDFFQSDGSILWNIKGKNAIKKVVFQEDEE